MGQVLPVHLALDIGMHHLGVPAENTEAISHLFTMKNLNIQGLFSHLFVSDSRKAEDHTYTQEQLHRFYTAADCLRRKGYAPGKLHIHASLGLQNLPPQPYHYVRAGIALYGVYSDSEGFCFQPEPRLALSLRAQAVCKRRCNLRGQNIAVNGVYELFSHLGHKGHTTLSAVTRGTDATPPLQAAHKAL